MIYIVTSGEYSNYAIDAIFSTEELAKKYIDDNPDEWQEQRIEEWEIDKPENIK